MNIKGECIKYGGKLTGDLLRQSAKFEGCSVAICRILFVAGENIATVGDPLKVSGR